MPKDQLEKAAQLIMEALSQIKEGSTFAKGVPSFDEPEVAEASEGALVTRLHRFRERDRKIVQKKKDQFLEHHGRLFCEVCDFDFARTYGSRGDGFIECHHTIPVSDMKPGAKTRLVDLALVCANCHRMIHAKRPWLSIGELKSLLDA